MKIKTICQLKDLSSFLGINLKSEKLAEGVIYGHLPSGKNNYEIGFRRMFKTDKRGVITYEKDFETQAVVFKYKNKIKEPFSGSLALQAKIYFRDFRRDLDTILFCDLLQKHGIVENDRSIRIKILDGINVDSKNPRIEFRLFKIYE